MVKSSFFGGEYFLQLTMERRKGTGIRGKEICVRGYNMVSLKANDLNQETTPE
jgi:hypothetical protein